ncbi:ceramidase-domain-containing protein [Phlyctochytrium arcticum]|nr:ceramidase-domain-containing protein [Phlyctochytrium arcticum]
MPSSHASATNGFNLTSLLNINSQYSVLLGKNGYWGPPSATLDWCEENYIVTPYLAEYWNAVTNLVFFLWPICGIASCFKTGSEKRFMFSFATLMIVGMGSFLFHGTLLYTMQLLDELPMAMATCSFIYCHLEMFNKKRSIVIPLALLATFVATVTSYAVLKTPIIFQAMFIVLTLVQLVTGLINLRKLRKTHPKEAVTLGLLTAACVAIILTAFALWNTDQLHCGAIQHHRNEIGYPFRIGLELHAWWHLLSGYSGYLGVVAAQYCRLLVLGRTDIQLKFLGGILPVCAIKSPKSSKVVSDFRAKKLQ